MFPYYRECSLLRTRTIGIEMPLNKRWCLRMAIVDDCCCSMSILIPSLIRYVLDPFQFFRITKMRTQCVVSSLIDFGFDTTRRGILPMRPNSLSGHLILFLLLLFLLLVWRCDHEIVNGIFLFFTSLFRSACIFFSFYFTSHFDVG